MGNTKTLNNSAGQSGEIKNARVDQAKPVETKVANVTVQPVQVLCSHALFTCSAHPQSAPVVVSQPVVQAGPVRMLQALYSYDATEDGELTFVEGESITLLEENDSGWWKGRLANGSEGLFPSNFVEEANGGGGGGNGAGTAAAGGAKYVSCCRGSVLTP